MLSCFVEHRLVTDGQTDRHRATGYTMLLSSCGKNPSSTNRNADMHVLWGYGALEQTTTQP